MSQQTLTSNVSDKSTSQSECFLVFQCSVLVFSCLFLLIRTVVSEINMID